MLKPRTPAPEIDLPDQNGDRFQLSGLRGRKNAVVFFYPKDDTPICTKEVCGFRDTYQAFKDANTEVIGISAQGQGSHARFAQRWNVPFILLSDGKGTVRKAYGIGRILGLFEQRITYVVDREGIIRASIFSMWNAERHVAEALRALRTV